MRRIIITSLTLIAAALLVVPATAGAQKRSKAPAPQITRVQPMRVAVGGTLTISGRNFKAQRGKNTLVFRAGDGRTAFAKPTRATKRKLVVRVPAAVSRLLKVANSRQRPTRLRLSVLAGKFSKLTPRRLSPVVTGVGDGSGGPGGGGPGGNAAVCNDDADHDNDLLANSLELAIGTDPCLADTDKDQMSDGWEYYAAKDLNIKAAPYPGERPYPNALDPSDGGGAGREVQPDRLRRRRPDHARGVPRLALHGQLLRCGQGRRHGPRVTARLQRRHEVQPPERDAQRAALARAGPTASLRRAERIPGHLQPSWRRRMA